MPWGHNRDADGGVIRFFLWYCYTLENATEEGQMGHKPTLDIPKGVYQSEIEQVDQTGQTPEAVAVQLLVTAISHRGDHPVEQFIGGFRSEASDWADQHDAYIGKAAGGSVGPAPCKGEP